MYTGSPCDRVYIFIENQLYTAITTTTTTIWRGHHRFINSYAAMAVFTLLVTYFLGVCLFSISFLVFLNSSVSFVVTDVIGIKHGVGDIVGTLGFADELVALIACPLWGLVSDVVGARWVCSIGYLVVGLALFLLVQAKNVYPQLLLARIFFSLGGAATYVPTSFVSSSSLRSCFSQMLF